MKIARVISLTTLAVLFIVLSAGCVAPGTSHVETVLQERSPSEQAADKAATEEYHRLEELVDDGKPISEEERKWLREYNRKLAKEAATVRARRDTEHHEH